MHIGYNVKNIAALELEQRFYPKSIINQDKPGHYLSRLRFFLY